MKNESLDIYVISVRFFPHRHGYFHFTTEKTEPNNMKSPAQGHRAPKSLSYGSKPV